jgi:peptide/nickel transport system ATP-binding protein/oligopeptide transport system ATP-binding protein
MICLVAPLLAVRGLKTYFYRDGQVAKAVDGVDLEVNPGETLALVGESGCGKSVTALSLLRLVRPPGRTVGGQVLFRGRDLLKLPDRELRRVRGNEISMAFQDPMSSLNPVHAVGSQIMEVLRLHRGLGRQAARGRAVELLDLVGIPSPRERVDAYPHQLSGGMCQRVLLAMALASEPLLLIADEPTSALDVTIQAQILELLKELQAGSHLSILFITHDLGVVAELADRVAILYAGKVVESGPVGAVFDRPRHPYTLALFDSLRRRGARKEALSALSGEVPDPFHLPGGCRFRTRCPFAVEACSEGEPPLLEMAKGHFSACLRSEEVSQCPMA